MPRYHHATVVQSINGLKRSLIRGQQVFFSFFFFSVRSISSQFKETIKIKWAKKKEKKKALHFFNRFSKWQMHKQRKHLKCHKACHVQVGILSRVMRKPAFCTCENKDADQLRGNCEADQRLCFRYIESTITLLPKSEISRFKPSSMTIQVGNPENRFSHVMPH